MDAEKLKICTTAATTLTDLLHARGLLVTVLPERLRVNMILNRNGVTEICNVFRANDDITHMAMLIRRTGHFREIYRIIDENSDAIGRQ